MDTLVMKPTESGYCSILVIVDSFTRYTWLYPVKTHTSEEVCDCLLNLFASFGICKTSQSDMGSEFNNNILKTLQEKLLFSHRYVLVGNHQANGLAESAVKVTLNTTLKMCFEKFKTTSNWDTCIEQVQFAINTRILSNLRTSPFFLMFGRNPFHLGENPPNPRERNGTDYNEQRKLLLKN
jgi:transposase InsO family protein